MMRLKEGSGCIMQSVNPSNYQLLGEVEVSSPDEVRRKVRYAQIGKIHWSSLAVSERVEMLRRALVEFEARREEVALLESREMGKPITAARSDFNDALTFANWYLDNAEQILSPETTFESDSEIHQVFREPIGVAAVIIPWNYPFLMFIWTVFPNLLAGNTVVLKHSEECPLSGQLIEEIMKRHLPDGVFSEVYGGAETGRQLVQKNVDLICFTGSTKTGHALYETAGKKFIRAVLELGGSAPGIIFPDADIDAAVKSVCAFRLSNAGQYCDGLKRLIVHESIFEETVGKLSTAFSAVKVGPAEDPETEMGPLAAKRQLDLLVSQVEDALACGARATVGGHSLESKLGGAFFRPAVLIGVTKGMRVWSEEVFGPVLPIMVFSIDDEAVALANDTSYGLGGYVYTADLALAERVAHELKTGMVSVNGINYTTPFNPFGGWKHSGMGREHGKWGFHELTQVKVVARPK